jgi:hypothetical protein
VASAALGQFRENRMSYDIFKDILDYIKLEKSSLEYEVDHAMNLSEKGRFYLLGRIMELDDIDYYIKELQKKRG